MERAETYEVGSTTAQMHEIAHHFDNVGGVDDALYGFAVDGFHR